MSFWELESMAKKEIDIIKKVVSILDSVDYSRYSEGTAKSYLGYTLGRWRDEDKLVAPIIFPKFLERVLGFKLGQNIGTCANTTSIFLKVVGHSGTESKYLQLEDRIVAQCTRSPFRRIAVMKHSLFFWSALYRLSQS